MNCKYLVASALQEELNEFISLGDEHIQLPTSEIGQLKTNHAGKIIKVATFSSNKMGMPYNGAKLMQITNDLNPKFILFIGTCAGIREEHKIGDVLIPDRVFSYESGKFEKGVFKPDFYSCETSGLLRTHAELLLHKIKDSIDYKVYTDGDFASGSAVINDPEKREEIIKRSPRKLYGIEMESYSVACLDKILRDDNNFLVIKGISDPAKNKDQAEASGGKEIAKQHAADFAMEFIKYLEDISANEEGQENKIEIGFRASKTDNPETTYPLKILINVQNNFSKEIVLESVSLKTFDSVKLHPRSKRFKKPLFLIRKKITYNKEKIVTSEEHVYQDKILLQANESVISCWIPIDENSLTESELQKMIDDHKVGGWSCQYFFLDNRKKNFEFEISI